MKLKVDVGDLSNSFKKIMPFVGNERVNEVVLFDINNDNLTIKCFNSSSNSQITQKIMQSDGNFKFVLKGKELNSLISTFNKSINIDVDENSVILSENKSKIKLNAINVNSFPENLQTVNNNSFEVDNLTLIDGLKKTIDFVDTKQMNILGGINIDFNKDILKLTATDGTMCSICQYSIKSDIEQSITIPLYIAKELIKNMYDTVNISVSNNFIKFEYDNFLIVSNLLIGEFPKVAQLIPKNNDDIVVFSKSDIENTIKKISLLNTKNQNIIKLNFDDNFIEINYTNNENSQLNEIITAKHSGDKKEIKLDYTKLLSIVKNFENDVTLKLGNEEDTLLLFENNENTMILAKCK